MNVTNAESIAHMYGLRADAWIGKQVTFFPTQVAVGRKMEDCLRVREKAPQQPDHPRKPDKALPPGWVKAVKEATQVDKLKSYFEQFLKKNMGPELEKEFGELLDQRATELEAEQNKPDEPKGDLQ